MNNGKMPWVVANILVFLGILATAAALGLTGFPAFGAALAIGGVLGFAVSLYLFWRI